VCQLSLVEFEYTINRGKENIAGVVLALVRPLARLPGENATTPYLRLYNLSSLRSLGLWATQEEVRLKYTVSDFVA
jgi:hypothetical protein